MLNKERNDKAMRPLRNQWRDLKLKERDLAATPDDPAKKKALDDWMPTFTQTVAELKALVTDYDNRIYAINQPMPRRYEIAPVK